METTEQLVDGIAYDPDPIYTDFEVEALFTFLSQPVTAAHPAIELNDALFVGRPLTLQRVVELVRLGVEITHRLDLETSDRVVYEKDFLRLRRTDGTYTVHF
eukprot:m51a1_g13527 hypothetical protein (102) ;mRNA; f:1517-2048